MVFHNTGCLLINNASSDSYFVLIGENPARNLLIPALSSVSFGGAIIPWCDDVGQIRLKAFRFFRNGTPAYFIFQSDYCFIYSTNFASPSYENRAMLSSGCSAYVDIDISASGTPSVRPSG
jgi:hypothetical protein